MDKTNLLPSASELTLSAPLGTSLTSPPASLPQWVEVLVDCGATPAAYTYGVPSEIEVQPGDILSVPFGPRLLGAIALRLLHQLPPELDPSQVRPVDAVICSGFFAPSYWSLLQQVAQYYQTALIQVIRVALPPGLLGRSQRRLRLVPDRLPDRLSGAGAQVTDGQELGDWGPLSSSAARILSLLQTAKTGSYSWKYLQQKVPGAVQGMRQLQRRGWVESYLASPAPVRPKMRQMVSPVQPSPTPGAEPAALTPRQQDILTTLQRHPGDLGLQAAVELCKTSSSTLKTLVRKGYLVIESREMLRHEQGAIAPDQPKSLTALQAAALKVIQQQSGFTTLLLHGVTGSGKTEVYLQAIAPILQAQQSVLVLVPEIGLTPQLTDRFRARFGHQVRVYHSALSAGERYDTWRQMLQPQPQIVIGTRSAIFAPLPSLGLMILDEEHDGSYKQDQPAPCYHARTIAHWRAQAEDCPLILGSATPALETWVVTVQTPAVSASLGGAGSNGSEAQEARSQSSIAASSNVPILDLGSSLSASVDSAPVSSASTLYLSLPERVHARPMPPIEVVDMRRELQAGNRSIFSRSLQTALTDMKAAGQQGLLFIHRRGHSTFVSCRSCGHVLGCPHCDVSLAYHQPEPQTTPTLRCHYCNYGRSHPNQCPVCASPYLKQFGSGTQRVIQDLARQFPQLTCLRFDSDTTRNKGAHRKLLRQFADGQADLLVGTQMLTKGIDLPQVTLVGIVTADGLLHMSDYRASERAFQTLLQAAGRTGRGDQAGQVILQTYTPEHPVIEAVRQQDYRAFATAELEKRQPLHYPPWGQLILIRLTSPDPNGVRAAAQQIAEQLVSLLRQTGSPVRTVDPPQKSGVDPLPEGRSQNSDIEILGPAPAPILKVARRYRWQILVKFPQPPATLPDLRSLKDHCPSGVSLTLDVDPLNMG